MKLPFFTQTITEMFGSKTNYVGLACIIFGGFQVFKGNVMTGLELIGLGLGLFGIKDAVVKAGK